MMKQWITILWLSFLVAGVADALFFTLFDPTQLIYQSVPVFDNRNAAYSMGFFLFWLIGIVSSALICRFQCGANPNESHRQESRPGSD